MSEWELDSGGGDGLEEGGFLFYNFILQFSTGGRTFYYYFLQQSLSAGGGRFFILTFLKRWHLNSWNLYTVFILTMLSWQLHESIVKITLLPWAGQGSPYTGGTCIWWMICTIHIGQGLWLISAVSHQYPAVKDILGMNVWENLSSIIVQTDTNKHTLAAACWIACQ